MYWWVTWYTDINSIRGVLFVECQPLKQKKYYDLCTKNYAHNTIKEGIYLSHGQNQYSLHAYFTICDDDDIHGAPK